MWLGRKSWNQKQSTPSAKLQLQTPDGTEDSTCEHTDLRNSDAKVILSYLYLFLFSFFSYIFLFMCSQETFMYQ